MTVVRLESVLVLLQQSSPAAPTELESQLTKAKVNGWRISWLQENPEGAGCASRARFEHDKLTVTIKVALPTGCIKVDLHWNLQHDFLALHDPTHNPPNAALDQLAIDAVEVVCEEWRHAQLLLYPKIGGRLSFQHLRGIILDVCSKLLSYVSSVVVRQLQIVMEEFRMDTQTSFRLDRGTIDGLFTMLVGLHKRSEHGLQTLALFIG